MPQVGVWPKEEVMGKADQELLGGAVPGSVQAHKFFGGADGAKDAFNKVVGAVVTNPMEKVALKGGLGFGAMGLYLEHVSDFGRHVKPQPRQGVVG